MGINRSAYNTRAIHRQNTPTIGTDGDTSVVAHFLCRGAGSGDLVKRNMMPEQRPQFITIDGFGQFRQCAFRQLFEGRIGGGEYGIRAGGLQGVFQPGRLD